MCHGRVEALWFAVGVGGLRCAHPPCACFNNQGRANQCLVGLLNRSDEQGAFGSRRRSTRSPAYRRQSPRQAALVPVQRIEGVFLVFPRVKLGLPRAVRSHTCRGATPVRPSGTDGSSSAWWHARGRVPSSTAGNLSNYGFGIGVRCRYRFSRHIQPPRRIVHCVTRQGHCSGSRNRPHSALWVPRRNPPKGRVLRR
jgi:hypothetical protein